MKVLTRLMAALVVGVAILAAATGLSTPRGRDTLADGGALGRSLWSWFTSVAGGLQSWPTAGRVGVCLAVYGLASLAVLAFLPRPVAGKTFTGVLVVLALVTLVLYQPTILPGVSA